MSYVKKEWKIKDFQKGDKDLINSLNHMEQGIAEGGGGGEPAEYLKDAVKSLDGNTLTITKKDGNLVIFTPTGGGGGEPSAYLKDATVEGEKLTITKKSGESVELDISNKLDKPVAPVAGEGINVPYYFDVKYEEAKAIVTDYTIDLLDATKAPKQYSMAIIAATDTHAGLMTAAQFNQVDTFSKLIPSQASPENKLADKDFVNSTVQTLTATFRGNFETKAALDSYVGEKKLNDYAVVQADETHENQSWRYKFNGSEWSAEYKINDSPFTAAQIAAINSGITNDIVRSVDEHINNNSIHVTEEQKDSWTAKQDAITDLADIRDGAAKGKTAIQEHQDISGKLDKPIEPVAGQGLNVPYYFSVVYEANKAVVTDYTIDLLDKSRSPQQFGLEISSATQTTAGLMSAADKKNVDEMLPAYPTGEHATESEYVLGLKYENGAWVKYWKETINRSDIVDSGMVDYMVLKI